jgi:hypothetical protein
MAEPQVLGVVSGSAEAPRVAYLNAHVPATPEILAMAGPVEPTRVLRLAARCEETKCTHFDGARCQLAARIVAMLPEVVETLPPCAIRPTCRWYAEEGRPACLRCPQIVTLSLQADERLEQVAGMPGPVEAPAPAPPP